ncbi:hypothetical protein [Streptomyces sp. NRRL WC-3626]|uniref:hypothetical protein n=1 Tax=Streptomyces sp. NRRL WC-3626 TaxID=1463926 RepID=UPI00068AB893|nr:hypothetical protein [Streptomyces sp. NRRL WC-3626]
MSGRTPTASPFPVSPADSEPAADAVATPEEAIGESAESSDADEAALVTADLNSLPTGRLAAREDTTYIFADMHELLAWLRALGGHVTHQAAGDGVTLWTLHTHTEPRRDGSRTPVLVHALAMTTELVPAAITDPDA